MLVNSGLDSMAALMGGDTVGFTGSSSSAPTSTTLTDSGASWTTNAYVGHVVTIGSVYGVIVSNTATVLTIDQWYAPGSPGGAPATTPSTGVFTISPGNAPSMYMGLSTATATPLAGDTALASEYATTAGGLIRKITTYAHTAGASSYSLAATFTVNGSDTPLPYAIGSIGIFNTLTHGTGRMMFETLLSPAATVSASGDAVTITDTVTT
jgi:hypothetical protein